MKKLKIFLLVLVVLLLSSVQLFSQSYAGKTDKELIQMLEQELNLQEELANQQAEHLQNLQEQLNKQSKLNKTLQEQLNNLQNQLQEVNKSYKKSKKDILKNKIIIGSVCLLSGFVIGSIVCFN